MVTLILPSAGFGTRFGAPFAKELLPVGPRRLAIDQFLEIAEVSSAVGNTVVVLRRDKSDLISYIRNRWSTKINLTEVYQEPGEDSWADGVLAAQEHFGERNVVFLPDTVISGCSPLSLVEALGRAIASHPVGFAACPIERVPWAQAAGALRAAKAPNGALTVTDYEEHSRNLQLYSHIWMSLGFHGSEGVRLMRHMAAMKRGEAVLGSLSHGAIVGAPIVEVDGYHDLGSWESYKRYIRSEDATR